MATVLDLNTFLERYAPCTSPVDESEVSRCLEDLRLSESLAIADHTTRCEGLLRHLATVNPIFKKKTVRMQPMNPNPENGIVACLIEAQCSFSSLYETDIIVPVSNTVDNYPERLGDFCYGLLRDDPRRMWIYALQFNKKRLSVEYYSQSHSYTVESFNYPKNPEALVVLLLSFASASLAQIGIDPLVQRCTPSSLNELPSYIYEIPNPTAGLSSTFYKTGRCLSGEGRGTRIWEVTQVHASDNPVVVDPGMKAILKDAWVDTHTPTEAENLDSIFRAVDDFIKNGLSAQLHSDDDSVGASPDITRQFIDSEPRFKEFDDHTKARLQDYLTDKKYRSLFLTKLHAWKGRVSDERGSTFSEACLVNKKRLRKYKSKRQARFVYAECCTSLEDIGTLGNFMAVIDEALVALQILFCAGWVHRDISKGNILAYKKPDGSWGAKLCDLEFAEPMGQSDPCMGTPKFMPFEIMKRDYVLHKFRGGYDPSTSLAADIDTLIVGTHEYNHFKQFQRFPDCTLRSIPANAHLDKVPQRNTIPRYNFQHDLESMWWLVLYFIFCRVGHWPSKKYAMQIFDNPYTSSMRHSTFLDPISPWAEDVLHPKLLPGFLFAMEWLRTEVLAGYLKLEVFGLLSEDAAYSDIHAKFATMFRELLEKNEGGWKDIMLANPTEEIGHLKRKLEASDDASSEASDAPWAPVIRRPYKGIRLDDSADDDE